ncbi:hypothetical protein ANCDUO_19369 [Ancylostoma duodenale]|uniref:Ras association domain protein n=1 Tax=Ancylostoma duodenale TaxID=51022 RepID=A0A0C2CL73_9BILA|nr:hypothetical protein ANCDUO_19369 [Ancylostoma duodenale]
MVRAREVSCWGPVLAPGNRYTHWLVIKGQDGTSLRGPVLAMKNRYWLIVRPAGGIISNYKSLLLAEETTCREAIDILLSMNRKEPEGDYALFLTAPDGEAQIPSESANWSPYDYFTRWSVYQPVAIFHGEH